MKPIYHFDCGVPPVLTKKMLAAKMEQRQVRRQMLVLLLAGFLVTGYIGISAFFLYPISPLLSLACLVYICTAIGGGVAVAIVFSKIRSDQECNLQQ